jgi:hypothetical protein
VNSQGAIDILTAPKERPILFSGPMIRALLNNEKTQTRRVIKGVFQSDGMDCIKDWDEGPSDLAIAPRNWEMCPYGQPGDRLWVRETFCVLDKDGWWEPGQPRDKLYNVTGYPRRNAIAYKCECDGESDRIRQELGYKWKPSIFMPRWASRLTLELTDVRVQRVQEITANDAVEEGCCYLGEDDVKRNRRSVDAFRDLWDSINAKRGYSWESNPHVWALTFRKVKP